MKDLIVLESINGEFFIVKVSDIYEKMVSENIQIFGLKFKTILELKKQFSILDMTDDDSFEIKVVPLVETNKIEKKWNHGKPKKKRKRNK